MNDIEEIRRRQQQADNSYLETWLSENPHVLFTDEPAWRALVSVILFQLGRGEDARPLLEGLSEASFSEDSAALSDYGLALLYAGDGDGALAALERAASLPGADAVAHARLGALQVGRNELALARRSFEQSLALDPQRAEVLSNLGGVLVRESRLQEALEYYNRALALKPDLTIAAQQRDLILAQLGRLDEVLLERQEALEKNPDDPAAHLALARVQWQADQRDAAVATLEAAIDRLPGKDSVVVRQVLIGYLLQDKKTHKAGVLLKEWLEEPDWLAELPDDEAHEVKRRLRLLLNEARIESGFLDAAEADLEELGQECDGELRPRCRLLWAKLLIERQRAEEAVAVLEEIVHAWPGMVEAYTLLSHTLASLGRMDEADAWSDRVQQLNPMAVVQQVEKDRHQADETQFAALIRIKDNVILPREQRSAAAFALHRVLEKREEYDRAFEVLIEANELMKPLLSYDWREHRRETLKVLETFTPELVAELAGKGMPGRRPIFVVGMPRSGTTLTEQILGSHSRVFGAGELGWIPRITRLIPKVVASRRPWPAGVADLGEGGLKSAGSYYLQKIGGLDSTHERVVDKMPHNFDYLGLIALALPEAKIIHLKREPRDVAVSNYQQNFAQYHGLMGFAYDLEWIGEMLNDHDRIMSHWHALFPGRIFELDYQELVHEPERVIRALLDFCELPWEDQCLRFYENKSQVRTASIRQVRRQLYTASVEKWRRYERWLEPLERTLAKGFRPLDDEEQAPEETVATPTLIGVTRAW
ncbi:tetratricopeptide repeat-containing sulfotransferase family protein [Desulfosoma caldarium]|uniref:Flp pilus assembly protein TadD n=1 Tax=Desulfosoma caldarium TaxID=610254 RepID=A0A3N1VQ20_9BACT|nr:tetratricopeptide repeat-containing sulfotransferase family protein [Desulfosoma caldarium]ROR03161.1 Flp pilus assembly protein TadD [Desulfosoma caldarium]